MREQLTAFQRALVDSVLKEYAEIPDAKDLPNLFSEDFQSWADTFQRRNGPKRLRTITVIKRILIAAIIAVLLASAAMAIPAVREAVINFFFHEDDNQIGITFDPEQAATAPSEIEVPYTIAYVPNSYTRMVEVSEKQGAYFLWTDSNGALIVFIQNPIPENPEEGKWWGSDAEGSIRKTILMGDYLVEIIDGEDNYKLVWTNNKYFFTLELPYSIDETEMQKIFASWGPKE